MFVLIVTIHSKEGSGAYIEALAEHIPLAGGSINSSYAWLLGTLLHIQLLVTAEALCKALIPSKAAPMRISFEVASILLPEQCLNLPKAFYRGECA